MHLKELQFKNIRNLEDGALQLAPHLTWVYGENGAGKTSLLEAVYLLSSGRSFRTNTTDRVIKESEPLFVVFGLGELQGQEHRIGLQRERNGEFVIRLNGNNVKRLSDIAHLMPVLAFTPDSYQLVAGAPKERRRFLDWGLFHVEHSYAETYSKFCKILRHRNALLRAKASNEELAVWTESFCREAHNVAQMRARYWQLLGPALSTRFNELFPHNDVEFQYFQGWTGDLNEQLSEHHEKELDTGTTRTGPQKADIRLRVGRVSAYEVLSRGQCKLLVQAMLMAQISVFSEQTGRSGILLLDDVGGELDQARFKALLQQVLSLNHWQVLVTSTDFGDKALLKEYNSAMFHVEHGKVQKVDPADWV